MFTNHNFEIKSFTLGCFVVGPLELNELGVGAVQSTKCLRQEGWGFLHVPEGICPACRLPEAGLRGFLRLAENARAIVRQTEVCRTFN